MAADFVKVQLSGSTTGKNIKVAATATPGTLIHTAHATLLDEVWIEAYNSDSVARDLTIEWGGVAVPDDSVKITLPAAGAGAYVGSFQVVKGLTLTNSLVVRAYGSVANVIVVNGFVNRIG
jgi:hypothetical protein